ncbi:MAG: hypothetical protein KKA73_04600 [Chloroflexi bacterium]|nr:hypothetical protein [Chloroflexota bacterium]MBU1746947.1 hypothetical protein [Chloroflexota bacterium]
MADIGSAKYLLLLHDGGDFTVRLEAGPSWSWLVADRLTDSLDYTLLFLPQSEGDLVTLPVAGVALIGVLLFL